MIRQTEIIIRETHRGLWYEDGKFLRELEPGRHEYPTKPWLGRRPQIDVKLVDMRERDLTIKGQEILTADKVSLRVSILVQFRVSNAKAALHEVENYEERLYSDVQLAARRALASMKLDEILTNRNLLSEQILTDVKEIAAGYGVAIRRADVKDLIFPGNLQEIMNQVLAAQRQSEAKLVQARTQAEMEKIQAEAKVEMARAEAEAEAAASRVKRESELELERQAAKVEAELFGQRKELAKLLEEHPAMLKLMEMESLRELGKNSNARIYLGFDRPNGESIRLND